MSALDYRRLNFPLGGLQEGRLNWAQGNQSVREVIWHILLTRPGERLMRPEFGAGLMQFIHQPNNETTRRLIADVALKAITRWEPRINLLELKVEQDPQRLNQVILTLDYRIKASGARETMELGLQVQS